MLIKDQICPSPLCLCIDYVYVPFFFQRFNATVASSFFRIFFFSFLINGRVFGGFHLYFCKKKPLIVLYNIYNNKEK